MECEICGKPVYELHKIAVEGSIINVCNSCARFGLALKGNMAEKPGKKAEKSIELVPDFGGLIRNSMAKGGMGRSELAKLLKEKESYLERIENEETQPNLELARKLEKVLNITLLEVFNETEKTKRTKSDKKTNLTIGDIAVVK